MDSEKKKELLINILQGDIDRRFKEVKYHTSMMFQSNNLSYFLLATLTLAVSFAKIIPAFKRDETSILEVIDFELLIFILLSTISLVLFANLLKSLYCIYVTMLNGFRIEVNEKKIGEILGLEYKLNWWSKIVPHYMKFRIINKDSIFLTPNIIFGTSMLVIYIASFLLLLKLGNIYLSKYNSVFLDLGFYQIDFFPFYQYLLRIEIIFAVIYTFIIYNYSLESSRKKIHELSGVEYYKENRSHFFGKNSGLIKIVIIVVIIILLMLIPI